MKNVQITYELFLELIKYHLLESDADTEKIKKELTNKIDALVMRELYSKYKTAPTEEEKEKARKEYLDRRGVPDTFRR